MVRHHPAERPRPAARRRTRGDGCSVRGIARHSRVRRRTLQLRSRLASHQGGRMTNQLAALTLVQAADQVAFGQTTSLELLRACWANHDAVNPKVNAVIWQAR